MRLRQNTVKLLKLKKYNLNKMNKMNKRIKTFNKQLFIEDFGSACIIFSVSVGFYCIVDSIKTEIKEHNKSESDEERYHDIFIHEPTTRRI